MLEAEAGLVEDLELAAVALLEGERLVEREAELARDHIEPAGEQIGLERGGVLDRPDHDAAEIRLRSRPAGVALEDDMRAGHDLGDAIGPVIEAGIGRVGVVARVEAVLRRIGESGLLEMRRQDRNRGGVRIVEGDAVEGKREGLRVLDLDLHDAAVGFGIGDADLRRSCRACS